jgi:hypothetical protein
MSQYKLDVQHRYTVKPVLIGCHWEKGNVTIKTSDLLKEVYFI